jgi:hypothetical protein
MVTVASQMQTQRSCVVRDENIGEPHRAIGTIADIETELRRLRDSKMRLVLTAQKVGLAAPRSCCPHDGKVACLSCSANWLVAHIRRASGAAN